MPDGDAGTWVGVGVAFVTGVAALIVAIIANTKSDKANEIAQAALDYEKERDRLQSEVNITITTAFETKHHRIRFSAFISNHGRDIHITTAVISNPLNRGFTLRSLQDTERPPGAPILSIPSKRQGRLYSDWADPSHPNTMTLLAMCNHYRLTVEAHPDSLEGDFMPYTNYPGRQLPKVEDQELLAAIEAHDEREAHGF